MGDYGAILECTGAVVLNLLMNVEGDRNIVQAGCRSLIVMTGSILGFILGGPMLAGAGGFLGGSLADLGKSIATGRPDGIVDNVINIRDNPTDGRNYARAVCRVVRDFTTGSTLGPRIVTTMNPTLKRTFAGAEISGPEESIIVEKKMKTDSTHIIEAKQNIPIQDMKLQTRVPDVKQVYINTCHDSEAIGNIAMGGLFPAAVVTAAALGAAAGCDDLRPNVSAREESQELSQY
ncbi:hypothetical protein ACJMK2_012327 [Sinanodonta woodiana]|uniref:Uncharacterized protein n=1 Tax=Sinanodonta woodiana TaxID=1069815 RepID=A0ABD3V839_SINWO